MGNGIKHAFAGCIAFAALFLVMLCLPEKTLAVSGCAALNLTSGTLVTSNTAAYVDCPNFKTKPCLPSDCKYTSGTWSTNCGPISKCVLMGEDPPVTKPQWFNSSNGFQDLGATIIPQKCGPPCLKSCSASSCAAQPTCGGNCTR